MLIATVASFTTLPSASVTWTDSLAVSPAVYSVAPMAITVIGTTPVEKAVSEE